MPVSGIPVRAREPAGSDELLVYDTDAAPVDAMLELVARLVTDTDGGPLSWSDLPAADLGAAALLVRAAWLGYTIQTEARCSSEGCRARVDVAFSIDTYLEHHRPRGFSGLTAADGRWLGLERADVRFRVPTVADLAGVRDAATLLERCVEPARPSAAVLRRVERALDAIAPALDGVLEGVCPECAATVELWFAPVAYVLSELHDASSSLFVQVHELALAYHWSEPEILRLERRRRHGYVELVRADLAQ